MTTVYKLNHFWKKASFPVLSGESPFYRTPTPVKFEDMPVAKFTWDGEPADHLATLRFDLFSDRARTVMSRLASEIEWYPAEVQIGNKTHSYWVLHILAMEDGIDFEASDYSEINGVATHFNKLVIKADFEPKNDVFRLARTWSSWPCFSQSGCDAMMNANLTGFQMVPIERS